MPNPAYSPSELEQAKAILQRTGPREIHDEYLVGKITSEDRRAALTAWSQAKRALDMQGGATGVGEVDAYIKGIVEQYQKVWVTHTGDRGGVDVVQALMLAVQVLSALDIPGDLVERKALQYGASPGLAYLMNWAVWIPVNFIGLGTWLKPVTFALGKGAKGIEATAAGSRKFLTYLTRHAAELDQGMTATAKAGELRKVSTAAKAGEATAVKRAAEAAKEGAVETSGIMKAGPEITPVRQRTIYDTLDFADITISDAQMRRLSGNKELQAFVKEQMEKGLTDNQILDAVKILPAETNIGDVAQWIKIQRAGGPEEFVKKAAEQSAAGGFLPETAKELGVTKELLEEALTSPQKLEAMSVDQLLDFYRVRAQEQVRKGVTHLQTEAEQVGAVSFDDLVTRVRGTGATAAEAK